MRRALTAAVGTVVGLIGLLSYKSGSVPTQRALGAGGPSGGVPPTTGLTVTGPSRSSSPSPSGSLSTSAGATTPPSTRPSSMADGTYVGPVVSTRYGPVQVRATIQGGRLVDVAALQLPNERARSAAISDRSAPVLRSEALAAQGAEIHTVSGATSTSHGYAGSLQAALDAARQ